MKKRQKKVQEFQDGLKVGDKVVTTGGFYGTITKLSEQAVQLQIAPKVRIDVARAAIGGFQGQDPVVEARELHNAMTRTFAGKSSPSSSWSRWPSWPSTRRTEGPARVST